MTYYWNHSKRYNDYSSYIRKTFGERVQKVSVNAGFTCPNRDGSKGVGGCAFCNNSTFNPAYCAPELSIAEQIKKGREFFFTPRFQAQKYLAYFQAYSNTYGETDDLIAKYQQALDQPQVVGLVLGTRPDCISDSLIEALKRWKDTYYIAIELGVESTNNATLDYINRGHGYEEVVDATHRLHAAGIPVGMHLILGLPGESRDQQLQHAIELNKLPVDFLKLHQLQIVSGSRFADEYAANPNLFSLYTCDEFIELVIDFMELLKPSVVMERFVSQAPYELLQSPSWGVKNFEFVAKVEKRLVARDTYQGKFYVELVN